MITSLTAALVVTMTPVDTVAHAPAQGLASTPAEAARHRLQRINAASGALHVGGWAQDGVLPFELEDGIEGRSLGVWDRSAAPSTLGVTALPGRARGQRYRAGATGPGTYAAHGFGGGGAGGAGHAGAPALAALAPASTVGDGQAVFAIEEAPAAPTAEAVAEEIVLEAAGGIKHAAAMRRGGAPARQEAGLTTPVPPSLTLFATGLAALRLSRRAGGR